MRVSFTVLADARGSISGATASKNGGTNYFRRRVKPVNGQSTAQLHVRALQAQLTREWAALTASDRASFISKAKDLLFTNKLGQKGTISGFQLFMKLNKPLLMIGKNIITVAPVALNVAQMEEITSITATAGAGTISIVFAPTPVPLDTTIEVYATRPLSPGISSVKSKYVLIDTIQPAATSPYAAGTAYAAKFGSFQAGEKIFFKFVAVDEVTGTKAVAVEGYTYAV